MNSFKTILFQTKKTMKELIEKIPLNDIALALKYEEQDIKDYFLENMNKEQKELLFALFTDIDEATPEDANKAQKFIHLCLNEIIESN